MVIAPTVGARHVQRRRGSMFKHTSAIGFHLNLGTVPKLRWHGLLLAVALARALPVQTAAQTVRHALHFGIAR